MKQKITFCRVFFASLFIITGAFSSAMVQAAYTTPQQVQPGYILKAAQAMQSMQQAESMSMPQYVD